jgi:dihydrofolate reductase
VAKLVVTEFVTVDGVMEDPGGAEGFDLGGWAFEFNRGPEGDKFKLDETLAAEVQLLGRVTYEAFAAAWPSRSGEFADKFNSMPKYVVSTTLDEPEWNNSTVIKGDVAREVSTLKQKVNGEILVAGSCQLVNTLLKLGFVDELRLMVFPVVLGSGKRLFSDINNMTPLRLVDAKTVGEGVQILVYQPTEKSS